MRRRLNTWPSDVQAIGNMRWCYEVLPDSMDLDP